MSDRIATISGVALAPGVSKNNRRYTPEAVQRAYTRLNARLTDPDGRPVVMRSFHPASGSDLSVTNIAGRLTGVTLREGKIHFKGDIADTSAGRDVRALVTPEKPYLANVSIHGLLVGEAAEGPDGIDTINDVEIEALDFVTAPGVELARIHTAVAEADGRKVITESAPEVRVTLETETKPDYADPGYKGTKQLPLTTLPEIRQSWVRLHTPAVTESYTPQQVKRMRSKIKSAAKKVGVDIVEQTNLLGAEILEAYTSVCVDNGPADLRVSAYVDDPSKVAAVTQKVAMAALAALSSLDPDNDGDIDLGDGTDDAEPVCPACACVVLAGSNFCPACGSALPATETDDNAMESSPTNDPASTVSPTEGGTSVSEAITAPAGFAAMTQGVASPYGGTPEVKPTPVTVAAPPVAPVVPAAPAAPAEVPAAAVAPTLNEADHAAIAGLVLAGMKPVDPAAPAPAAAAAPVTTEAAPAGVISVTPETVAEMIRKGINEGLAGAKKELADETVALFRSGGRRGLVRPADESGNPKAIHEMSVEERETYANEAWAQVLNRAPA